VLVPYINCSWRHNRRHSTSLLGGHIRRAAGQIYLNKGLHIINPITRLKSDCTGRLGLWYNIEIIECKTLRTVSFVKTSHRAGGQRIRKCKRDTCAVHFVVRHHNQLGDSSGIECCSALLCFYSSVLKDQLAAWQLHARSETCAYLYRFPSLFCSKVSSMSRGTFMSNIERSGLCILMGSMLL
jgi:hypothetical protein